MQGEAMCGVVVLAAQIAAEAPRGWGEASVRHHPGVHVTACFTTCTDNSWYRT
jgi:hypothetical protein